MSDLVPVDKLAQQSSEWVDVAARAVVKSSADASAVAAVLGDIKALRSEIQRSTDPVIKAANLAHKAALAQRGALEGPLIQAEAMLKKKVGAYIAEEARLAREQAMMQEAIARKEREKAELDAQALEAAGEMEFAEAIRQESQVEAAAPIVASVQKITGLSIGETWTFEVVDLAELVRAVAFGNAPPSFLKPNDVAIGGVARATKGTVQYPGVRIFSTTRVGTR